jgi:site-specific DNA-cytosine methylase
LRDILETDVNDELSQEAKDYMNRSSDKWSGGKTRKDVYIKHESEKGMCLTANMHKGVPYGVIALDKPKQVGSIKDGGQGNRIYSQDGKSSTLSAQSGGTAGSGNTLVETKPKQVGMAADIKGHDILRRVYSPEGKSPCLNAGGGGNREPKVAQEGLTWRKLTPLECERLQTVPDNYTNHVSNTQRYKMLGNGWTVEVIKHILRSIKA